jgi:thymidine kinase
LKDLESVDCIGIDEGQFFDDIVEFCELNANKGKVVIVSALDSNFKKEAFGKILDLIPKCEEVTKLKAVCMICFKEASFSKRICKNEDEILIGGSNEYISVCRKCYE